MKKNLLILSLALMGMGCYAQPISVTKSASPLPSRSFHDGPISTHHLTPAAAEQLKVLGHQARRSGSLANPSVDPQTYTMSGYFFTYGGMAYASGIAQQVAFDGNQVYFSNLFPIMLEDREVWTVGELSEDGTVISVPVQHIYDNDWYDIGMDVEFYMGDIMFDEEGNIASVQPFEFCKNGDLIYIDDLHDVNDEGYAVANHHIGIFAYGEGESDILLYDYVAGHKLSPYEAGALVACPAEANVEEYVYRALNDYGDPVSHQLQVAFCGNDIYFNGLTPDMPNWVHGTLGEDNVVTIPSDQYVGVLKYFYTYFAAMRVAGQDPNGDANFHIEESLQLLYDPETGDFTYADPDVIVGELIYTGGGTRAVLTAFGQVTISALGEAKPATPSAPYEVFIMDLEDYGYEQWTFGFLLDNKGTNDEYLFPAGLEVYMFMDDELFTFDTDEYWIDEPVCGVGYEDIDSNDAFYHDKNVFEFYVNKTFIFNRLGAVAAYTADGETHYSDIAYIDLLTEEVTYEQLTPAQLEQLGGEDVVAIEHVEAQQNVRHYDLQGRLISAKAPGLHIIK